MARQFQNELPCHRRRCSEAVQQPTHTALSRQAKVLLGARRCQDINISTNRSPLALSLPLCRRCLTTPSILLEPNLSRSQTSIDHNLPTLQRRRQLISHIIPHCIRLPSNNLCGNSRSLATMLMRKHTILRPCRRGNNLHRFGPRLLRSSMEPLQYLHDRFTNSTPPTRYTLRLVRPLCHPASLCTINQVYPLLRTPRMEKITITKTSTGHQLQRKHRIPIIRLMCNRSHLNLLTTKITPHLQIEQNFPPAIQLPRIQNLRCPKAPQRAVDCNDTPR
jgi:hypothetical protein